MCLLVIEMDRLDSPAVAESGVQGELLPSLERVFLSLRLEYRNRGNSLRESYSLSVVRRVRRFQGICG